MNPSLVDERAVSIDVELAAVCKTTSSAAGREESTRTKCLSNSMSSNRFLNKFKWIETMIVANYIHEETH